MRFGPTQVWANRSRLNPTTRPVTKRVRYSISMVFISRAQPIYIYYVSKWAHLAQTSSTEKLGPVLKIMTRITKYQKPKLKFCFSDKRYLEHVTKLSDHHKNKQANQLVYGRYIHI